MDPVSVFKALYDTKCLKFGQFDLKSGLVAPYYIDLRCLSLYPELMGAVVTQVVEKFLTNQALVETASDIKRYNDRRVSEGFSEQAFATAAPYKISSDEGQHETNARKQDGKEDAIDFKRHQRLQSDSDADSQLGDDDGISEGSSVDGDWEKVVSHNLRPILCGVPYGAVPLAASVAFKAKLPYLLERNDLENYGDREYLMEGFKRSAASTKVDIHEKQSERCSNSCNKLRVVLIEDVICSGESVLNTIRNVERRGLKVEFVICIIDQEENGINMLLEQAGIQVLPLYKMSAILRVLEITGRITSEQFINTRQWMTMNQFQSIGVNPPIVVNPSSIGVKCSSSSLPTSANENEASIKVAY